MKKNFEHCLEMLLEHEGGYVNHPKDPGGITNLGVTLKTYAEYKGRDVTDADMRALTPKDVAPIYKEKYWDKCHCDDLPAGLDWMVFDWAVNSGPGRSAKALQRIVGETADGAIGPKTIKATFNFDVKDTLGKMYDSRQKFYESLKTFETFGRGWSKRNDSTFNQAVALAND
tara:strand:+ start:481 stop:996 length:516 start_codon:yes stop_codon:yes gene_type:complete